MNALAKWATAAAGLAGGAYAAYVAKTWLRYGHVTPSGDALLDRFMPEYEVGDLHSIDVAAPADVTLAIARDMPMDRSRIVRAIFRGRELIMRGVRAEPVGPAKGIVESTTSIGWGVLADEPTELVMGAITKPWEANPTFRSLPPEEFAQFREPGYVKIVWTVRAEPASGGGCQFSTETRAVATDPEARAKFRVYWSLLSPGIKLIRTATIGSVKKVAERRAHPVPGDDIIAEPRAEMTHAIDIDAPPGQVWPWLVQMGCRRGGWYSWDVLDNGGVRSADHIIPELQHLAVGDVLPMRPEGSDGFTVLRIEPDRALVLGSKSPDFEGTWAFALEPLDDGKRTRLVTRYRGTYPPSPSRTAFRLGMTAIHAIMERKQLRTIKHHAEHCN